MQNSKNNNNQKPDFSGIIKAYDEAVGHYDFVINDLSSEIYDPVLQAQKEPVIAFLTAMRDQWKQCRKDVQKQLDSL